MIEIDILEYESSWIIRTDDESMQVYGSSDGIIN